MRRPVLATVGQVWLWFAGVAFLAVACWVLAFSAPWDDAACPVAAERPSSAVGGMGMPGRAGSQGMTDGMTRLRREGSVIPGSGWNGQESRGSGHGE